MSTTSLVGSIVSPAVPSVIDFHTVCVYDGIMLQKHIKLEDITGDHYSILTYPGLLLELNQKTSTEALLAWLPGIFYCERLLSDFVGYLATKLDSIPTKSHSPFNHALIIRCMTIYVQTVPLYLILRKI